VKNLQCFQALVIVSFNRRLTICHCQAGWTQRGMVKQLTTSFLQFKTLASLNCTIRQLWAGWLEVCVVIS